MWNGGPDVQLFRSGVSLVTAAVFFTAILECSGLGRRLKYLWPFALIAVITVFLLGKRSSEMAIWAESILESVLFHRGRPDPLAFATPASRSWVEASRRLASSATVFTASTARTGAFRLSALFRVSLEDLFGITMGIAMAVLVLEAGRARMEDLNEKLRRLAMITAEATQSLRVHQTLDGVLRNLVAES